MFIVAAAELQREHGDPAVINALRSAAKEKENAVADGRNHSADEQKRIDRQRSLMAHITNGPAKAALLKAMLQRAYDLMWDGQPALCDALAEWLPSESVKEMFDAWETDQEGKLPRSRFYNG